MGFRFNKTFKTNADPFEDFLNCNTKLKYKFYDEEVTMTKAFNEKNPAKFGAVLSRWKILLLLASPAFTLLGYFVFTYSDQSQLSAIKEKEKNAIEKEKELLESSSKDIDIT